MIEKLKAEKAALDAQIEKLNARRKEVSQQIADLLCPFNVGERVALVNGEGEIVDTYLLEKIRPSDWSKPGYDLFGRKIKVNGEPGVAVVEIRVWRANHTLVKTEA